MSHMFNLFCILVASCFLTQFANASDAFRAFSSTDGKTITATVVNFNPADGKVVIRREDGRKFTVPFERFSEADQKYLLKWRDEYDRSFYRLDFMGAQIRSSRIIFLIDKSGSMSYGRWDKLIHSLKPVFSRMREPLDFNIITFGSTVDAWSSHGMLPATEANKIRAFQWLSRQKPSGGTATSKALEEAFQDEALETIILLSDGLPMTSPENVLNSVMQVQSKRENPVTIHTISYQSNEGSKFLKALAEENEGDFTRR